MDCVVELKEAIETSVKEETAEFKKVGVLFSGGIDSSVLAMLCKKLGKEVTLYSVFMENSHDEKYTLKAAEMLNLKIVYQEINIAELEALLSELLRIAEIKDYLSLSIKLTTYAALKLASKRSEKLVLSGQGADELFGGYARYLEIKDKQKLQETLKKDFEKIKREEDEKLANHLGMKISFPYMNEKVSKLAFAIPVDMKIKNGCRKAILREVGKEIKLPEFIVNKEKKAMQYSSGVEKALRRILPAKSRLSFSQ